MRRRLAAELEREGVSAAGFSALVVLTTAGGTLELKTLRRRLGWSKANATEVTATLETRDLALARMIAGNNRASVIGIKALLLDQMAQNLEQQWLKERHYTTHVVRGAKAEEAFSEFIARRGRPLS